MLPKRGSHICYAITFEESGFQIMGAYLVSSMYLDVSRGIGIRQFGIANFVSALALSYQIEYH